MIRPTISEDSDSILNIVVSAGLFTQEETPPVKSLLDEYLSGTSPPGNTWLTCLDDNSTTSATTKTIVAVAYYAPAAFTDGKTWELLMIAVNKEQQGSGRGKEMMRYIEDDLKRQEARILIVDTSGLSKYDKTREFYLKCGFEMEGRIRDFYTEGEDKVTFRKRL
ncbi:hypothetical protein HDU76_014093 [Blyttiomyces sp. JEL0837]|nr:hypothetical protein HDU76_014093 [Blyttiomyces sp. JEL0837]